MWKKIIIAVGILMILLFAIIRFGAPYYIEKKIHFFLNNADTASYKQIQFDFWEGNLKVHNLFVIDSSGSLAQQPLKLNIELIVIKHFNLFALIRTNTANVDSLVITNGSISLPIHQKEKTEEKKKQKEKFIKSLFIANVVLTDVHTNLMLDKTDSQEYINAEIYFRASNVLIPLQKQKPLAWQGDLTLNNFKINDSKGFVFNQPFWLHLDHASLHGLDAAHFKAQKLVEIDSLTLGKGDVTLGLVKKTNTAITQNTSKQKAIEGLSLKRIHVDSVHFALDLNTQIAHEKFETDIQIEAEDLVVPLHKDAPFKYATLQIALNNLYYQPKKSIAYYQLENVQFSSENKSLELNEFRLKQRLSETQYANHFGTDKLFVELAIFKTTFKGLPAQLESLSQGLHLQKLTLLGAQSRMYKDKRLPHPDKEKKFPFELLQELNFPLHIDTIAIVDAQLFYNENWREDYVPGRIALNNMHLAITNVSSTGPTKFGDWTRIDGKIELLNNLQLDIDWRFDLRKKAKFFTLRLNLGTTSLASLNPFTENTFGIRFKKGTLQGGQLYVEADKKFGKGTLDLYYKDMRLNFMDNETHNKNFIEWAGGGLANLVARNNNMKQKNPKQGYVYAERVTNRSIIAYVIRLFFSGFKDIALSSSNKKKAKKRTLDKKP